jgi:hypothetical protein
VVGARRGRHGVLRLAPALELEAVEDLPSWAGGNPSPHRGSAGVRSTRWPPRPVPSLLDDAVRLGTLVDRPMFRQ